MTTKRVLFYAGAGIDQPDLGIKFDKYILSDILPARGGCSCCLSKVFLSMKGKSKSSAFFRLLEKTFFLEKGILDATEKTFTLKFNNAPLIYHYNSDIERFKIPSEVTDVFLCNYSPQIGVLRKMILGKNVWLRTWSYDSDYPEIVNFPSERTQQEEDNLIKYIKDL